MISHLHRCIFIHLRRTGGNSIEIALDGIELLDQRGNRTFNWDNNLHRGNSTPYKIDRRGHYMHDSALAISKQYPEEFAKYFKFSVVRNPWDQMVSLYLRLNASDADGRFFNPWVEKYFAQANAFTPEQHFHTKSLLAGTSAYYSLFDDSGVCLVDEIARFENLKQDFERICSHYGIKARPLPLSNSSSKQDYAKYYNDRSIELVRKIFQKDIDYFDYSF